MAEEGGFLATVTTLLALLPEFLWLNVRVLLITLQTIYRSIFPQEPKSVNGDLVLITGAGHGMGREMALRFGKLGATVVCVDINPAGNQETIAMIKKASGVAHAYQCDITDKKSVDEMAEKVRKEVGDVSILVNNAGIMPCKSILNHTEQDVKAVVNVNVLGNIWTIQAFLPAMLKRNRGHIVAMSSMCGLQGTRNVVPYCATKYAVRGLMEALDVEFDDYPQDTSGIKTTTVYPYLVNTGLAKKPKIRFESVLPQVNPGEAADIIIDAVRREYRETTVPANMLMQHKVFRNLPIEAVKLVNSFVGSSLDPHDK